MRPIPHWAIEQCGVFSVDQAYGYGWTSHALRHAVKSGRLTRLRSGAYQVAELAHVRAGLGPYELARWQHAAPAIAAVLTTPGAAASHSTAAVLHTLPLLFMPERSCVSVAPWVTGEIPRLHVHRCTYEPWTGPQPPVSRTGIDRTIIDLAREHGMQAGLIAADYAVHQRLTSRWALDEALGRCARWPGVVAARDAIAFCDGRAESPLESRSRLALRQFGIPTADLQVAIGDSRGGFVARVDFYWDECGVVGEADGAVKYDGSDPDALVKEKRRQADLEELGLGVVRWGSADLQDFGSVAERLRRTFARGRRRPASDRCWTILPPTLTFPAR